MPIVFRRVQKALGRMHYSEIKLELKKKKEGHMAYNIFSKDKVSG